VSLAAQLSHGRDVTPPTPASDRRKPALQALDVAQQRHFVGEPGDLDAEVDAVQESALGDTEFGCHKAISSSDRRRGSSANSGA
jgi:hypothetical protein